VVLSTQIATWKNEKSTLLDSLTNQTTNANNQFDQLLNNIQAEAASVATTNTGISTTHLHETNEQTLNDIYLSSFAIDVQPDSLQMLALEAIADQCPLEGGTPVYRARALVQGSGYDDYALCDRVIRVDKKKDSAIESFNLFPNPTTGQLNLQLPSNVTSITILNTLGIQIHHWSNRDFPQNWTIQNLNLSDGLYYCVVETSSGKQTQSFVIIK